MTAELELLKDIPGYRAILKSVLKAQIQMLMDQLSTHTGEESIVLTASVHDGSLYHLGSEAGKGFLEGKDELKAEFLGFCLKCEHKKEKQDKESQQYGQSHNLLPPSKRQRPRIRPGPYSLSPPSSSSSMRSPPFSQNSTVSSLNQNVTIQHDANDNTGSFMESNESEHVTTAANGNSSQQSNIDDDNDDRPIVKIERDDVRPIVKIERDDVDDENSLPADENWEHNGESEQSQEDPGSSQQGGSHLGGIAFPGLDNAHHDFSSKPLPEISTNDLKQALYPQDMLKENVNINSINDFQHNGTGRGSFGPSHRKKGRPPKNQSLSRASHHFLKSNSSSQFSDDISLNSAVRKRGRPRKNCDEDLPPGVVHPMGISIGNGHVKCNICGKILKATSMFSHKQSHLGIRNYSCEFCGKSFTQKGPLITHKRVHTGEKPYTCPRCGKCFAAHSGLYQHSRRCDRHALMNEFN